MDSAFINSLLSNLILLSIFLVSVLFYYLSKTYRHWKKKGVHYLKPSFFFGNIKSRILFRESEHEFYKKLYLEHKEHRMIGIFAGLTPILFVRDSELIKHIMVKDFEHFVDRETFVQGTSPYFDKNLLRMKGKEWKRVRALLTPTFTSHKMKLMSHLVKLCGEQMENYLQNVSGNSEFEMKYFFNRYTLDVIASCAFGVQCNSLKDSEAKFLKIAVNFGETSRLNRFLVFLLIYFRVRNIGILPLRFFNKETEQFFVDVLTTTKRHREKHNERRDDFFQLLLDAKKGTLQTEVEQYKDDFDREGEVIINENKETIKEVLTDEVLMAQAILFLIAGFETSSTLLTFASYELALHPDIQDRLRKEILDVLKKYNGECTYEAIQEMTYLDMVLSEALRKYPPVARLGRVCTQTYVIPGTNVTLGKGDVIYIPIIGLHHDETFYPNPERFDPDRFLPENKAKRSHHVYLPFGSGPRNCIGKRFALMSSKIGLASLLRMHKVVPCEKTEVPFEHSADKLLLHAKNGIWLSLQKL